LTFAAGRLPAFFLKGITMSLFRNVFAYRLAAFDVADINDKLQSACYITPGLSDLYSRGFVPPADHTPDLLAIETQDAVLVALRTDEKILPASVVRRETDERIKKIEAEEGRKVGRREMREIRDRVSAELLPKAFIKSSIQRAIIDTRTGFVFVDGSSASKAEDMLSLLREALGSLSTRLIDTKCSPQTAMTVWLQEGTPEGFALDSACELKFPGEGGAVAKFNRQALETDEVRNHLAVGKLVTMLGLVWRDRLAFKLTDTMQIKSLQMLDILHEEIEQADAQDQAALFDSTLALMIGELRELVPGLIAALGGEEQP
jgi:recombination associated protein RdgC